MKQCLRSRKIRSKGRENEDMTGIYEYPGYITIADRDADVVIPDCAYRAILDSNILHIYDGIGVDVTHNGVSISVDNAAYNLTLDIGDIVKIQGMIIEYMGDSLQLSSDRDDIKVYLPVLPASDKENGDFPYYKRSPRLIMPLPHEKITILKPSARQSMAKGSLLSTIIPPLITLVVTAGVSILMRRGLFVIISIVSTLMATIMSVIRYINNKKDVCAKNLIREERYDRYLLSIRKSLNEAVNKERAALRYNYPSLSDIEKMIEGKSDRIYERSINDEDFIRIHIGTCRDRVCFPIEYSVNELDTESDELDREAKGIYERFSYIDDVPVVVDLKKSGLGLVGDIRYVHEQIKLLIAELTFLHSYHDLQIVLIHSKEYREEFDWMRWYPHLNIQSLNVIADIDSEGKRDQILGSIHHILKDRKIRLDESRKESRFVPWLLFVIDEPKLIMDHSIMELLRGNGEELGFSIIYSSRMRGNLPEYIRTIVEYNDSNSGRLVINEGHVVDREIVLNHIGDCNPEWMARNLSVFIHDLGTMSGIPESVTFYEMYGVNRPEELNVDRRWNENCSYKSLAVPLGVRADMEPVYLNLHEKAHGPHGLIAGTTGSGKSEIIQSYILSLAVNFHPYEVGFLLIDYKGGGMAGLFDKLPHLLGIITNLDGSESLRALASIKSELSRRQKLFSVNHVNHIDAYNKLYRNGEVEEPIPHLFLISDEFAELKKEQPDFMKELVSTARIGRSLGVHLILATQKPSGVVDDQIWTNSKFKLALKVQSEADSKEILRTPDAAYITQPGRAYLQVGNNEVYELFQSAWSGAEYYTETGKRIEDNRVYLVNELGQGVLLNDDLSNEDESIELKKTQLDATIEYIEEVFMQMGIPSVRRPWLPALSEQIINPVSGAVRDNGKMPIGNYDPDRTIDMCVGIGVMDIPEEQMQREYSLDIEKEGNIAFFASAGFGKTMFITNIVLNLAINNQVEDLNFYILDLGNSALIPLNALPHTADYMLYDDTEKISKLINILKAEMAERKRLFAKNMVQNFNVYNQTANEHLKAIVVVVDNFDIVKELDQSVEDFFVRLSRDGAGLGIFMIITATRVAGVKYSILSNFKNKIAGFLFENTEANTIVGRSDYKLTEIRGRALVKADSVNLMQIYSMVEFANDIEYNDKIKDMVSAISSGYGDRKAARIPILPDRLYIDMLGKYEISEGDIDLVLGLDSEEVKRVGIGRMQSPFVILGDVGKGKTNALKVLLAQIKDTDRAYVFDSSGMELFGCKDNNSVTYIQDDDDVEDCIMELSSEHENRKAAFMKAVRESGNILPQAFYGNMQHIYIFIDDIDYMLMTYAEKHTKLIDEILQASECGIQVIVTAYPGKLKSFDALSKSIKSAVFGLVLSPQGSVNIFPVRSMKEYPEMGQGLLFGNGTYKRIMIPESTR